MKKKNRERKRNLDYQISILADMTHELSQKLADLNGLSDNLKACNSHLQWLRYNVKLSVDTDALLNKIKTNDTGN